MKKPVIFIFLLSLLALSSCESNDMSTSGDDTLPEIISISTEFGGMAVYGCPITITGSDFSSDPKGNAVMFGDSLITELVRSTECEITVNAPVLEDYTVPVMVISDGIKSKPVVLRYDEFRCDSVTIFRNAEVVKLREGVVWTSAMTTWQGEPRSLNVISIVPSETNIIGIACPSGYETTSSQGESLGALAAINAAYFGGSAHDGFVRIGGEVIKTGGYDCAAFLADAVFMLAGNLPSIRYVKGNAGAAEVDAPDVVCCGPLLIYAGMRRNMDMQEQHNNVSHPRTAIGITSDGKVLFVTVDGRAPANAVGMSTELLARFMKVIGAEYAMNLDGGGSTTMWIKGKGVVNHPSDGGWDAGKERKVGSIIYLK